MKNKINILCIVIFILLNLQLITAEGEPCKEESDCSLNEICLADLCTQLPDTTIVAEEILKDPDLQLSPREKFSALDKEYYIFFGIIFIALIIIAYILVKKKKQISIND